jgi:hypothetical protein
MRRRCLTDEAEAEAADDEDKEMVESAELV